MPFIEQQLIAAELLSVLAYDPDVRERYGRTATVLGVLADLLSPQPLWRQPPDKPAESEAEQKSCKGSV